MVPGIGDQATWGGFCTGRVIGFDPFVTKGHWLGTVECPLEWGDVVLSFLVVMGNAGFFDPGLESRLVSGTVWG